MELKADEVELFGDFFPTALQKLRVFVDEYEVVHIADIVFDVQFLFDVVVEVVEDGNTGDLNHLATGEKPDFAGILFVEDFLREGVNLRRKVVFENRLYYVMAHIRVVALNIALEDVALCSMFPVKSLKKTSEPVASKVCSFILLTGSVIIYETLGNLRVDGVVVEASLIDAIAEGDSHNCSHFPVTLNGERAKRTRVVFATFKLRFQLGRLFDNVQNVMRDRSLPHYAVFAFSGRFV